MDLRKEDVSSNVSGKLSLQEYKPGKLIKDVRLIDFDLHADDGGDFHEIARLKNGAISGLEAFELRQINRSRFNPGLVKAFHLHMKQDEVWAVHPLDRLLVGLLDVRKSSSTEGTGMRIILGGGKPRLLFIPLGVAHGGMVLDQKPIDVIYLANQNFSPTDPDEWRLPWNILGEDFWQIKKE
jgi:dTDP-4-dehydrorhamnose 3,5-epimerase